MTRKKSKPTTQGGPKIVDDVDADDAPARPAQKIPERLASPFAKALAGVKPAPAKSKAAAVPAKGAASFASALAARSAAPAHAGAATGTTTGAGKATATAAAAGRPRSFAEAQEIRERGAAPEAKAAERSLADRTALRNALAGVKPLTERDKRRVAVPPVGETQGVARGEKPDTTDLDADARKRLAGLVAGELRFDVREEPDGHTEGTRVESGGRPALDAGALAQLARAGVDDELDLHGKRGDEADVIVSRWVRAQARAGARTVRIVHGKGLHSDVGGPVLRERVVVTLTEGVAAMVVLGFVSAATSGGGTGALIVRLTGRV